VKRHIVIGPDTKLVNIGGRPPPAVLVLLIVQLGLLLAWAFADGPAWINKHIALSASEFFGHRKYWQPLTALWISLEGRAIIDLLTLWLFGSALERFWGSRRFVVFFVVTGSAALLAAAFVGLLQPTRLIAGSAGAASAMLAAFAFTFPNHLIFFYGVLPLKAKLLAPLLLGFVLLGSVLGANYVEGALLLAGAAAALPFLLRRGTPRPPRRSRPSSKLQVIEGGKKDEPRYWN
jgi:membrane associated rhomboid family serine protease